MRVSSERLCIEAASWRLPASTAMTALVRAYPSGPTVDGLWLEGVLSILSKKRGASGAASMVWSRWTQNDFRVMSLDRLAECMVVVGIKEWRNWDEGMERRCARVSLRWMRMTGEREAVQGESESVQVTA
jgi:hypothetical protein